LYQEVWQRLEEVFREDPSMLEHTRQVFDFAHDIAQALKLDAVTQRTVHLAALLHDAGIVEAEKKFGSREGKFQHITGPPIARKILEEIGEQPRVVERVLYLVGNHHNFDRVDEIDFQVLIEADMLVNLEEEKLEGDKLRSFIESFFKTAPGLDMAKRKYLGGV
jgi:hypothetical protein